MAEQLTFDLPVRAALGREEFFVSPANAATVAMVDAGFEPIRSRAGRDRPQYRLQVFDPGMEATVDPVLDRGDLGRRRRPDHERRQPDHEVAIARCDEAGRRLLLPSGLLEIALRLGVDTDDVGRRVERVAT